jgi:hypothetical protein
VRVVVTKDERSGNGKVRRRVCAGCGYRWYTLEVVVPDNAPPLYSKAMDNYRCPVRLEWPEQREDQDQVRWG